MGEQKPETEYLEVLARDFWVIELAYGFGKDIENGVSNDLSINGDDVSTLRQGPNTLYDISHLLLAS